MRDRLVLHTRLSQVSSRARVYSIGAWEYSRRDHRQIHTGDCSLSLPAVLPSFSLAFQHPFPTSLVTISQFSFQFQKLPLHILSPCDSSVAVSHHHPYKCSWNSDSNQLEAVNDCFQDLYWNGQERETLLFFLGLLLCQDAQ